LRFIKPQQQSSIDVELASLLTRWPILRVFNPSLKCYLISSLALGLLLQATSPLSAGGTVEAGSLGGRHVARSMWQDWSTLIDDDRSTHDASALWTFNLSPPPPHSLHACFCIALHVITTIQCVAVANYSIYVSCLDKRHQYYATTFFVTFSYVISTLDMDRPNIEKQARYFLY